MSTAELISRVISIAGYVVCLAAALILVVISHRRPDRLEPFGAMLDRVTGQRAVRITLLLFWWWLGWHFLVTPPAA